MARKHVFILVVILGAAALSGLVAMARTTGVGAPAKAAPAAASPALDARLRQLTRFEKRLKKQLAKKPAKHAATPRAPPPPSRRSARRPAVHRLRSFRLDVGPALALVLLRRRPRGGARGRRRR